ncbi:MAG: translocation/assembly module TamB domain-containing protein [Ignavibacteriota bacterium]
MTENVEQTPPQKTKRSFLQRLTRVILVIIIILLLLTGGLISFTQTSAFRNIVRSQIEGIVEKNTNSHLTLGRIEGNLISGFTIYDVHLRLRGDSTELLSMKELYASYSLWKLIRGTGIPVTTLIMRAPEIHFVKASGDSLWNYERLIPSSKNPSASKPFDLVIDVQNLRIENGKLFVLDHNRPPANTPALPPNSIDWYNYALNDLQLDMRAHIEGEKLQRVQINNLSFSTEQQDAKPFNLHHLELSAYRNDLHTEVSGLHLISDGSDIRLSAEFDPLNVLRGEPLDSLKHSKVKLHLSALQINERELRRFLPDLEFLDGSPALDLDAEGEFGALKITRGHLGFHRDGDLSFAGELKNLHDPQKFYMDVVLKAESLSDRTLRNYVPGLQIADMQRFGSVGIEKLTFRGTPDNFVSLFDIHTSAGAVSGKASLDLRGKEMIYDAEAVSKNINLARLFSDSSIRSDLNSSLKIKGRGTDPKTMAAEFTFDGEGTTAFKNYQLQKLHVGGKISGGILHLENTDIALRNGATLRSQFASIDLSKDIPSYDFDLTTSDLAITEFVPMFPASSRVSVVANLSGSGASANNLSGSISAEISGLQQDQKPLPNIELNATLDREPGGRRVDVITSSIADLTFKGRYNIETIGSIIAARVAKITKSIEERGQPDRLNSEIIQSDCSDSIDLAYTANIKDLRPVAPFIPHIVFLGSGKLDGSILGCEHGNLTITTDGNIHNFFMRQRRAFADSGTLPLMRLRDTKFTFSASGLSDNEADAFRLLHSEFSLHSDSIFKFNTTIINNPDVAIKLDGGKLLYHANGIIGQDIGLLLSGTGDLREPDLSFQADSLSLTFNKLFVWHLDKPAQFGLGTDGSVWVDTLSLIRPKPGDGQENKFAERVKLGMRIKGDSILHAFIRSPEFDLADISKFFPGGAAPSELVSMKGRVNKLEATMNGTLSHPNFEASIGLRNVVYHEVTIDSGMMDLRYKDMTLSGGAEFHVDTSAFAIDNIRLGRENFSVSSKNSFQLNIDSIPLLFNLATYPQYVKDSIAVANRTMSIRASGKDYPLDMFSPFVPVIANLHGLADIELSIGGTRENILYKGSVITRKGSFLLPTTNMQYIFDGTLLLSNDEMKFVGINLANMPADDPAGRATLNGSLYFKGFNVEKFDLSLYAPNRISVLSNASEQTLKMIYGPLAIQTVTSPLTFTGSPEAPLLEGNISVVEGFLTMPQTENSSANLLNDGITYRIKHAIEADSSIAISVRDSSAQVSKNTSIRDTTMQYNDTAFEIATRTAIKNSPDQVFSKEQLSFQDKLLYDLQISIPGNLWFVLNLSKAYGLFPQILTAEIKTKLPLTFSRTRAGAKYYFNGDIYLTDKSTFKFIKDFSPVTGTLSFTSDLENPSLNVTAEYTGIHKTTSGSDETIKIKLIIEGTLNDQQLTMELYRRNNQGDLIRDSRSSDLVQGDILTYLTTGSFVEDGGTNSSGSLANAPLSVASQQVSGALTNYLGSTFVKDYIKSVGVEFVGLQSAKKLYATGGYKDLILSYGGTLNAAGTLSSDFTAELPFSAFFNGSFMKKIIFSASAHLANSSDPGTQGLAQPPLFLGKLLFRFP